MKERSDVFFMKTAGAQDRITALKGLIENAGPFGAYKKNEFIPVKITIGDSACVYNLGPEIVKTVIFYIKKKNAKPFIFDTSVIYSGERQNAVDHLNLAQGKGFAQAKIGAPFIIADGLLGQDGREFDIESQYLRKIKVPSFVGMLDSLVVLSHATGHILSGFAGAIKNVAMGMACRPTKQVQHSSLKPSVIEKKCAACGLCAGICPAQAITLKNKKSYIDKALCLGCGECLCACKFNAIFINWTESPEIFSKRMVEVAKFILSKFKDKFFINFAFDITQECDCISTKDDKMAAQDLGIFASRDIVSLDKATIDMALQRGITPFFEKNKGVYMGMLDYASQKGLGNLEYNFIDYGKI